jgi:hypothetical protein
MFAFLEGLKKGFPASAALQTATGVQGDVVEQIEKKWLQVMLVRAEAKPKSGKP